MSARPCTAHRVEHRKRSLDLKVLDLSYLTALNTAGEPHSERTPARDCATGRPGATSVTSCRWPPEAHPSLDVVPEPVTLSRYVAQATGGTGRRLLQLGSKQPPRSRAGRLGHVLPRSPADGVLRLRPRLPRRLSVTVMCGLCVFQKLGAEVPRTRW